MCARGGGLEPYHRAKAGKYEGLCIFEPCRSRAGGVPPCRGRARDSEAGWRRRAGTWLGFCTGTLVTKGNNVTNGPKSL